ncbi:MAG TPA: hypothetical protein VI322_00880 [Candidatus Saccharimonadia bacterium]
MKQSPRTSRQFRLAPSAWLATGAMLGLIVGTIILPALGWRSRFATNTPNLQATPSRPDLAAPSPSRGTS